MQVGPDQCVYAVLERVIFGVNEEVEKYASQGISPNIIRLHRQITYFGDEEGHQGLLKLLSNDEASSTVVKFLWGDREDEGDVPYRPFAKWPGVEDDFRDLVLGMANLDPQRRLTARQALEHPWFKSVNIDRLAEVAD